METSTIVFDFGNVLIGWDPRRVYRDVLGSDSAIDAFFDEVGFAEWNLEQDRGRSWSDAVTQLAARFPHRGELIRAFDAQWDQSITGPIEGTVRILEKLHATGYRLIGLTNWSSDKFAMTRPRYPMFDLFEEIIVSGDVRLVKPDPEIFRLMLRLIGSTASECLFIDDSAANITAAKSLGFRTIHFQEPAQLERELREQGMLKSERYAERRPRT